MSKQSQTLARKALALIVAATLACVALCLAACGSDINADATDASIDSVTLPTNGSLVYDFEDDEEGVVARQLLFEDLSKKDAEAYAKELSGKGYTLLYEETADNWYGFSATHSDTVTVAGTWAKSQLSLVFVNASDAPDLSELIVAPADDTAASDTAADDGAAE